MRARPKTAVLADLLVGEQVDAKERLEALRLQARAWRILAIVATHDQQWAIANAKWLMFVTVPFVDGEAVRGFVEENEVKARECGELSGVFSRSQPAAVAPSPGSTP